MLPPELVIRGRRVVTENSVGPPPGHITSGYISSISIFEDIPAGCELIEAGPESIVMPGLVDTHVHVNEPGRTDWEGFETATRAAAAGGVTTILDMPLNSIPPTTSVKALEKKMEAVAGRVYVHVGFWGGAVPDNRGQLEPLRRAGVFGFKSFLAPSGVEEFGHVGFDELTRILEVTRRLDTVVVVHAEDPSRLREPKAGDKR